ncbi:RagB/SusD family nutrient uptake outer membrane protein [Sphingobacterium alkalisoli]|uniref:RagB/SusD family nutrient uptake outer membrane protein n=1 Tax=Sphingobacterium alkalisoli TaxID=1874115 RepID=A0A4V5LY82_9SPHI|nr:RagB/SusD family nutrient uptake outer membrane protein [Sphingobacterium alkalisoli]TJY65519.1 RagB/SusD family nutrient uptake outer membrane protein [Sphingobacterium alkalisoli]GGH19978.1 glycan metabolism protein RagB [Sphingobacterium alkalisoli]
MKKIIRIIFAALFISGLGSCSDYLDINPRGQLGENQLNTVAGAENLVIAAYSALGNDNFNNKTNGLWPYGDLRSGDAYKGGAGTGDMGEWNLYETFVSMRVDVGGLDQKWYRQYVAISRVNNALRVINGLSADEYPNREIRIAEMRFLRAHYMFELKILFKHVPFVDESIAPEAYITVSNREFTDAELWSKIIDEFRFAASVLPELNEGQIGRANKYMAKAYLAKALLYAAYEQNEQHEVINIHAEKLEEVVTLVDELDARYDLSQDFAFNFLCEYENGPESIFAVQHSLNDGTEFGRLDWSAMLNYPMNAEYGCCGFHQPTQNLVNAFKTSMDGLPLFETYNSSDLATSGAVKSQNIDPRLLHTVAIVGLPYKYKTDFIFQNSWIRQIETYGNYMSLKEVVLYDNPCFKKVNPFMSSSKNRDIIRFDDVLLWKAEALIELGRHMQALPIINLIRNRAAESVSRLVDNDGQATGKFVVEGYEDGVNCVWSQSFARKALRWERRLELAMEGFRFFDLVRWGIADTYVNEYLEIEKTKRNYLAASVFKRNRDEYFPIPLSQINFSKKLYQQNYGWN